MQKIKFSAGSAFRKSKKDNHFARYCGVVYPFTLPRKRKFTRVVRHRLLCAIAIISLDELIKVDEKKQIGNQEYD